MARPKLKGDPITFRLPLHLDAVIRQRADEKGQTVNEYCRTQLERSAEAALAKKATP